MRKDYIDNIKWITVVLVVIYHVFYFFNANNIAGGPGHFYDMQPWDAVQYLLYPWFMALLFVVSGMNVRSYLNSHSIKDFIKNRTRKLLVPSTIGLFVFQWIQGYINILNSGSYEQLKEAPILIKYLIMTIIGSGVLWFLQLLWLLSILLVLIIKLEKNKLYSLCEKIPLWVVFLMIIPFWGSAQILNAPVIVCYKFGIYGFSFLLGYFIFSQERLIDKLSSFAIPLATISLILGVIFTLTYFGTNYADMPVFGSPLSMSFAYITILAVLSCMKKWGDKQNKFTKWMTKKSWGLYIFHYLGISGVGYILYTYSSFPPVFIYILTELSAFFIGYGMYEIISRIPIIRWCILGIKRR